MRVANHLSQLLHRGQLARAVHLPGAGEAPQLALEVAGGLCRAVEPRGGEVHGVHRHQGVDELVGDHMALAGQIERRRQLALQHVPPDQLHDHERRADQLGGPRRST